VVAGARTRMGRTPWQPGRSRQRCRIPILSSGVATQKHVIITATKVRRFDARSRPFCWLDDPSVVDGLSRRVLRSRSGGSIARWCSAPPANLPYHLLRSGYRIPLDAPHTSPCHNVECPSHALRDGGSSPASSPALLRAVPGNRPLPACLTADC
jgi:hypothetical protein